MKVYVAPKAAVLSMNVSENIASSARVTFNGTYYYNVNDGKLMESEFVYTGDTYVADLLTWIIGRADAEAQKEALDGCLVPRG